MTHRHILSIFLVLLPCIPLCAENCWESNGCLRISGVGHGFVAGDEEKPLAQRQLIAMRAAKIDALRALAEQVNGIQLQSQSALNVSALTQDQTITQVSANLQGVRYIRVEPIQPDIYQAVVEIDVYR